MRRVETNTPGKTSVTHTTFHIRKSLLGRIKTSNYYAGLLLGVFLLSTTATTISVFYSAQASIGSPVVSGGQIFGTGDDTSGALGNGAEDIATTAVQFPLPSGVTVQKLIQTQANIVVLGSDNQVYSAGRNANGEFGIGNQAPQGSPVRFELPGGVSATDVAAYFEDGTNREDAIFVLGDDGRVYGAGSNMYGVLGNGGGVGVETSPVIFQLPVGVVAEAIYPQKRNMFVLGSDGNLYGAGENYAGNLGNGTTGRTATPVVFQLPVGVNAVKVASQNVGVDDITVVIADDGNVYSAGSNSTGQFGDGTSSDTSTPVEFQLPVGEIAEDAWAAFNYTSVVTTTGELYSAGLNYSGQLGDGTGVDSSTPVRFDLPVGVNATEYVPDDSGESQGVIANDGNLYIAGANYYGQIGDGTYDDALSPQLYPLPGGASALKAFISTSVIVQGDDGSAYVSGANWWGQMGTGSGTLDNEYLTPQRFESPIGEIVTDIEQNTVETSFASFVIADDKVYGAGTNFSGAIGNGTLDEHVLNPAQMQLPSGVMPKSVHPNYHGAMANTCVISATDDLYCVGINLYGQLGTNQQMTYASTPQGFQLPAGVYAEKMLSSYRNLFVLGSDGNVYGAGNNQYGQLGDGTTNTAHTPVRYGLPIGVSAVDIFRTGLTFISVLGDDGNLYSAGNNNSGMFGAGVTGQQATPVVFQLPVGVRVVDVAETQIGSGATAIIVIADDGNAYGAGTNNYGQVGSGSVSSSVTIPERVALPVGVVPSEAFVDALGSYILGDDGNVYGAGRNNYGQLGDASMSVRRSPVVFQLPGGVDALGIANDRESTFVLGDDGNVYGAGRNNYGQLGDSSLINRSTPVVFQLPGGQTVQSIDDVLPFQQQRLSVRTTNGEVYSAGNNSLNDYNLTAYAPFGNGTPNSNQSTPVQFQLPGGVTARELVSGTLIFNLTVIGSDGNLYASGVNLAGFNTTAPYASSTPIQMVLPAGETVASARSEYRATFVITDTGNVYATGCNNFDVASQGPLSGCPGWLGNGSYLSTSTPQRFALAPGLKVASMDLETRDRFYVMTDSVQAVGSQVFCDTNTNASFDGSDYYINGGTIDLYAASGGAATGGILASYDSATYGSDDGTIFFDGLAAGDYILGSTINGSTIYSTAFTLDGSGDGWILGSNPLIATGPLFGVTGSDCSDIVMSSGGGGPSPSTPPSTPGDSTSTPGTGTVDLEAILAETGMEIIVVIAAGIVSIVTSGIVLAKRAT